MKGTGSDGDVGGEVAGSFNFLAPVASEEGGETCASVCVIITVKKRKLIFGKSWDKGCDTSPANSVHFELGS